MWLGGLHAAKSFLRAIVQVHITFTFMPNRKKRTLIVVYAGHLSKTNNVSNRWRKRCQITSRYWKFINIELKWDSAYRWNFRYLVSLSIVRTRVTRNSIVNLIMLQMDCRRNIWPIENTSIFTTVTSYLDANDVEEQLDSVSFPCRTYIVQCHRACQFELSTSILIWVIFAIWFLYFLAVGYYNWYWSGRNVHAFAVRRVAILAGCMWRAAAGVPSTTHWSHRTIWLSHCPYYVLYQWKSTSYRRRYAKYSILIGIWDVGSGNRKEQQLPILPSCVFEWSWARQCDVMRWLSGHLSHYQPLRHLNDTVGK